MADLTIEQCRPSDRAAEIQDLFARTGQPEFAAVYRAVYQVRERQGMRSWVGMVEDRAVLHISLSLEPFVGGARSLTCGLPGDLMTDEAHRDFWNPLKLVRRMVADVRATRMADFVVTTYVSAAEAVFKAAGFKPFAEVHRYVLPLTWPYPLLRRWQHRERIPPLTAIPFRDASEVVLHGMDSPGCFRPVPSREYFATRMPRKQYPAGTWLVAGPSHSPDATILVSPQPNRELLVTDVFWRESGMPLAGLLSAAARWAARNGHRRLSISPIPGSRMADAAQRAGFLRRPGEHRVMLLPVCPLELIPPPEQWSFTPFVLTGW